MKQFECFLLFESTSGFVWAMMDQTLLSCIPYLSYPHFVPFWIRKSLILTIIIRCYSNISWPGKRSILYVRKEEKRKRNLFIWAIYHPQLSVTITKTSHGFNIPPSLTYISILFLGSLTLQKPKRYMWLISCRKLPTPGTRQKSQHSDTDGMTLLAELIQVRQWHLFYCEAVI